MSYELNASIMCADFTNLEREVRELEKANVDSIHVDIMDGRYVPNYAMSLNDLKAIKKLTKLPVDLHLMIEHPNSNINLFFENLSMGDTIYIHPESEYHPSTTLHKIISAGFIPGIVINPGTSLESIMELLVIADKVLVMAVNPGYASQMFLPYTGDKIERLIKLRNDRKFKIYWDGACNKDIIKEYAPKGVDGFIMGTAILYGKNKSYTELVEEIRTLV